VAVAGRCDEAPVIDGNLGEDSWQVASVLGPFLDIRAKRVAEERTYGRVAWDDANLYVAFECRESEMAGLVLNSTERDANNLWTDDAVELFVSVPGQEAYVHIIVNAAGVVRDEWCRSQAESDVKWDSTLTARTSRGDKGWAAEIAIPWSDLHTQAPKPGDTLRLNLNREQQQRNEWSGWAMTQTGFHEPECFGVVRFEQETLPLRLVSFGAPFIGPNVAAFRPAWPMDADINVRVTGAARTGEILVLEPDGSALGLQYLIAGPEPGRVGFEISRGDTVVFRTPQLPYSIDRVDLRLAELAQAQTELEPLSNKLLESAKTTESVAAVASQWSACKEAIESLQARYKVMADAPVRAQWDELGVDAAEVTDTIMRLAAILRIWETVGGDEPPTYGIGVAPSTVKVLRDVPFDGELGLRGHISLCRNEYEALQFVMIPVAEDLEDITVTWGSLIGPGGAAIPKESIEINRVGYVKTRKPRYPIDYVGWYPDPLMPLDAFGAKQGQNQPIWVGVKAPKDIPAGSYSGEITLAPGNADPVTLTLVANVWDVTLPDTTTLKTAISSWYSAWSGWYGDSETSWDQRKQWFQFMLDRRINPGTIYSRDPYWDEEEIRWCVERGMNAFCAKYQGDLGGNTPEERAKNDEALAKWAKEYAAFLRENGWIDKGYVYGFDEVRPDRYAEVVRAYSIIKHAAPDLKTACTVVPNATLNPVMDIWVPLTPHLENRKIWQNVDDTDEMWWYVCCGPLHPHANWFIDYSALEHRLLFWQTYKYKVEGFLYYSMHMWRSNQVTKTGPSYIVPHDDPEVLAQIDAGKRWPEVPWNTFTYDHTNGDGHLFYPGPNRTLISCQRLENIRDGIEDYELLHELETATDELQLLLKRKGRWVYDPWGHSLQDILFADSDSLRRQPGDDSYLELIGECRSLLGWRPKLYRDLTHYTDDPAVLESEREKVARQLIRVNRVLARLGQEQ